MNRRSPSNRTPYVKHHGLSLMADWQRVNLFASLVSCVEGLATAAPLWKDESAGTIAYERLPHVQPLLRARLPIPTFRAFGRLLARLHVASVPTMLTHQTSTTYPLDGFGLQAHERELIESKVPTGFFWGDCWHGNVFTHADGRFYVIDPLPHRWLFDDAHFQANGAFDLALLHMSLFFSHPLLKLVRLNPSSCKPQAHALLVGYLEEVDALAALPVVVRLSHQLATRYIAAYRRRLRWPVAVAKQRLSERIMRSLDANTGEVS